LRPIEKFVNLPMPICPPSVSTVKSKAEQLGAEHIEPWEDVGVSCHAQSQKPPQSGQTHPLLIGRVNGTAAPVRASEDAVDASSSGEKLIVQGSIIQFIDEIDWSSLEHAYGCAHDTPAHLKALASDDADVRAAATDHLFLAVIHQGFPESANAPTARVIAMMLAEEAAHPEVREVLVEILGNMAESTWNAERMEYAAMLLPSLEEAMQQTYPLVLKFLEAPDLSMRRTAGGAAIWHVRTRGLAHHRPALAARLRAVARQRAEERVYWVRDLASLRENTEEFLVDPNVHVGVAAALSPALRDNAAAAGIIVDALSHAAEHGVANPDVYDLTSLVWEAVVRIDDLSRIAAPAAMIARNESWTGFCDRYGSWGPLMRAFFRPPYSEGARLTPLQRDFLAALLKNTQIWSSNVGNISLLFKDVGLPFDREACARLIDRA
jgi:hypothetical protein